ncbi:MAG: glycoside hydrolase family 2 protein [Candidatus Acidiferrales bacterium]
MVTVPLIAGRKSSRLNIPTAKVFLFLLLHAILSSSALADSQATGSPKTYLHDGWTLQSGCKIKAAGAEISSRGFTTDGWHKTRVPSTVVASLVADKTYPDPDFGMNLRKIPGATYPIGKNFGELPMPKDSPFRCAWWYRTEFSTPDGSNGRHVWLHLNGINYRANIWLNGRLIAGAKDVLGMDRVYEFDITPWLAADGANVLAVETFAQTETDLGINWQDWNPAPPDRDMGLYSDVYLRTTGPVEIRDPQVVTHFTDASNSQANLTVIAELYNATEKPISGSLEGIIEGAKFQQPVTLKSGETRTVKFMPDRFSDLSIKNPAIWWPAQMGQPQLHDLSLRFKVGDEVSDAQTIRFGIREITSELTGDGSRLFRVNGKKILVRGGGWAEDMLLRRSRERLESQFQYVLDMHLNTLRLEGQIESEDFYDLADEKGILLMPGWVCCTYWQLWEKWKPGDLPIAVESLRSQALRLRRHPSVFVWLNGSDIPPPPRVERAYLKVLKETDWPNPSVSSASAIPAKFTGPSGMKMTGPYNYVPPAYWLTDPGKYGGATGFNSETSPGPAIPTRGSLEKMLPADRLWPINEFWNYHAASESFANVDLFTKAMTSMFGAAPAKLDDYLLKSQAMAYDGERAMFEAYSRNKYASTGVIQWMANNSWPSIYWHLYDYYLQPAGGYFGAKKACEPLHVQYSYDDRGVVVVNSSYQKVSGLTATAEVYDFSLDKIFSQQASLDIDADGVQRIVTLPPFSESASPVYFVRLTLRDSAGKLLSSNFYWLSSKPANIEWAKTAYFDDSPTATSTSIYTPASPYDDLKALDQLPRVRLTATAIVEQAPVGAQVRVKVTNPSSHLAFQICLAIRQTNQTAEILPVLWEDNYFELMPGESREITVRYLTPGALAGRPELVIGGWNIDPSTVPLGDAATGASQSSGGAN